MQNNVLDTVKEFNKICFDILQVFGLLLFFFFFLHLVNAGDVAHLIKKALALPLFMMKIIRTKNCPLRFFFFFSEPINVGCVFGESLCVMTLIVFC